MSVYINNNTKNILLIYDDQHNKKSITVYQNYHDVRDNFDRIVSKKLDFEEYILKEIDFVC